MSSKAALELRLEGPPDGALSQGVCACPALKECVPWLARQVVVAGPRIKLPFAWCGSLPDPRLSGIKGEAVEVCRACCGICVALAVALRVSCGGTHSCLA